MQSLKRKFFVELRRKKGYFLAFKPNILKNSYLYFIFSIFLFGSGFLSAGEIRSTVEDQQALSLTVYNQNFALIRDKVMALDCFVENFVVLSLRSAFLRVLSQFCSLAIKAGFMGNS